MAGPSCLTLCSSRKHIQSLAQPMGSLEKDNTNDELLVTNSLVDDSDHDNDNNDDDMTGSPQEILRARSPRLTKVASAPPWAQRSARITKYGTGGRFRSELTRGQPPTRLSW
jgi:hypothetical protein